MKGLTGYWTRVVCSQRYRIWAIIGASEYAASHLTRISRETHVDNGDSETVPCEYGCAATAACFCCCKQQLEDADRTPLLLSCDPNCIPPPCVLHLQSIPYMLQRYRSRYNDSLRTGRSGDRFSVEAKIFRPRPPSLLYNRYRVNPGLQSDQGVALTTQLLVPRLKKE